MRIISEFETQFKLGQQSLTQIKLNYSSRDDITKFLLGIQHISGNRELMKQILTILSNDIAIKSIGRSGMSLWRIFVLGLLRQAINADYDRVCNLANNHRELRHFLGHGTLDSHDNYALQTIKDNVFLLTDKTINKINELIVHAGHAALDSRVVKKLNVKTDSFVVKSNVHYPTDTGLLFDAIRFLINFVSTKADKHGVEGWREYKYYIRKIRKLKRKATTIKRSTSKKHEMIQKRQLLIEEAHLKLINECKLILAKLTHTYELLNSANHIKASERDVFQEFTNHTTRQISQIYRRVMLKESIPHSEKVFSLFNPFTEWISKGKAGVPVELGLKVSISTDQHGFILAHRTMEREQDVDVAIPMVTKVKRIFDNVYSTSFDRGYYSSRNNEQLKGIVHKLILPKKGKISRQEASQLKADNEYATLRRKHSGVESNINGLEHHALDRCPDKGIENFRKYVSMSVVAHNIHQLGMLVQRKLHKKNKHKTTQIRLAA